MEDWTDFILTTRHHTARWIAAELIKIGRSLNGVLSESCFAVSHNDGQMSIWRHQGEWFAVCNVVKVNGFCGGSMMVCVGISFGSFTDL